MNQYHITFLHPNSEFRGSSNCFGKYFRAESDEALIEMCKKDYPENKPGSVYRVERRKETEGFDKGKLFEHHLPLEEKASKKLAEYQKTFKFGKDV